MFALKFALLNRNNADCGSSGDGARVYLCVLLSGALLG